MTNAAKHFRFERRGARRIHKTPAVGHVRACRPWLDAELVPTIHPSAILRLEPDERDAALDAFVADLTVAAAQHV